MKIINRLKSYLSPAVTQQIQENIDWESMRNIYHVSIFVFLFEVVSLAVFALSRAVWTKGTIISVLSVLFCICTCLIGALVSRQILTEQRVNHNTVVVFKVAFFSAVSMWSIYADYRHYLAGEQMLTFITVQMIMVCFMLFRPMMGLILTGSAYSALYLALYISDRAVRIQIFNYIGLALTSAFGMMVRYHTQLYLSTKTVWLAQSNQKLEELSRHDGLTGLLNRKALEDDVNWMIGGHICVYMADINCFKEINDSYGHTVGDEVLREVGNRLIELFPKCRCYRYGGDEFLILNENAADQVYQGSRYELPWTTGEKEIKIELCFGSAEGELMDRESLLALIKQSDDRLYDIKKRVHQTKKEP